MTFRELEFDKVERDFVGTHEFARAWFPNGYGASVVRSRHTYGGDKGLYELAVLGPDKKIDYSTPITNDVEGWLTPENVTELLQKIEALPQKVTA